MSELNDKKKQKYQQKTFNLKLDHIFGITARSKNCMSLNSNGELAYACGSVIVIYNISLNKQSKYLFSPNKKNISCLTYTQCGKFLIAGEGTSKNPEIHIFDIQSDAVCKSLKGHKFGIEILKMSPNQKYLISIGDENDKGIFVWDFQTFQRLSQNKVSKKISQVTFNSLGTMMVTSGNGHLKFWPFQENGDVQIVQFKDKEDSFIIEGKSAQLSAKFIQKNFVDCEFQDDYLTVITQDGILCLLNSQNRQIDKWMNLKTKQSFSLQIHDDKIICGCSDGLVRIFKPITLEYITTLPKPPALGKYNITEKGLHSLVQQNGEKFADVIGLNYDTLRHRLICLYSDRSLFVWDMLSIEAISVKRSFFNHNGTIHDLQILQDTSHYEATFFVSCGIDQTARIWYLIDEESILTDIQLRRNIYCKNLSRILYANTNSVNNFLFSETEQEPSQNQLKCIKSSYDGTFLAVGDQDGVIKIFNLIDFSLYLELLAHDQEILCIDFTQVNKQNKSFLASGSRDRIIHVFDANKGFELIASLDVHSSSVCAIRFGICNSQIQLISCGADKSLVIQEFTSSSKFVKKVFEQEKNSKIFCIDMDPHCNSLIIGQERKISQYSLPDQKFGKNFETKEINQNQYLDNLRVAIDPSGQYVAISNNDKIVRIRELKNGTVIAKAPCGDIATGMVFTQNSKHLIISTSEGTIQIWSLGQELKSGIEKKKQQLGIIKKKITEMFGRQYNI